MTQTNDVTSPASLPATVTTTPGPATWANLFGDDWRQRCLPGALEDNTGPLAYLNDLYALARRLERDVSFRGLATSPLLQRRADIAALPLGEPQLKKVVPALDLALEVLDSTMAGCLAATADPMSALATATYPPSLPFNADWHNVLAVLSRKRVTPWDMFRGAAYDFPNFAFHNIRSPGLRLALTQCTEFPPGLITVLARVDKTPSQSSVMPHYGMSVDTNADALGDSEAFRAATGLTQKELRQLLAVTAPASAGDAYGYTAVSASHAVSKADVIDDSARYGAAFVNNGTGPALRLMSPLPPADGSGGTDSPAPGLRIEGLALAHLDRIWRLLQVRQALGLSFSAADRLLTAIQYAEGRTKNFVLTAHTFRAIGMYRHMHLAYAVDVDAFAALVHDVSGHATGRDTPFFDRIFSNTRDPGVSGETSPLLLDDAPFSAHGTDEASLKTIDHLGRALRVTRPVLVTILAWIQSARPTGKDGSLTRSPSVLSACYRLVSLPRWLGLSDDDGVALITLLARDEPDVLSQLAGQPTLGDSGEGSDIIDVIAAVMNAAEWITRHGIGASRLNACLSPEADASAIRVIWITAVKDRLDDYATATLDPAPEALEKVVRDIVIATLGANASQDLKPLLMWAGTTPLAFGEILSRAVAAINAATAGAPKVFSDADILVFREIERRHHMLGVLGLSYGALEVALANPGWLGLASAGNEQAMRPLDLTTAYQLSRFARWTSTLPAGVGPTEVIGYRDDFYPGAADATAGWIASSATRLAHLTATTAEDVASVTAHLANKDRSPVLSDMRDIDYLLRLRSLSMRTGLPISGLLDCDVAARSPDANAFGRAAASLLAACESADQEAIGSAYKAARRNAIVAWLLGHWQPENGSKVTNAAELADYLLLDVNIGPEPKTTRVESAIGSLQVYIHRLLSRLERGIDPLIDVKRERLAWDGHMSRYASWRERRALANDPANFIDPTKRLKTTTAFRNFQNTLSQGRARQTDREQALLDYLSAFEKTANIQTLTGYEDGTDPVNDTYHFIGKSNVQPAEYFWRTVDMSIKDSQGGPSAVAWSEWEPIALPVSGELAVTAIPGGGSVETIRPVVIAGRRYVVWVERDMTGIPLGPDARPSIYRALRVNYAFLKTDGQWSSANTLITLDGTDGSGVLVDPVSRDKNDKPLLTGMDGRGVSNTINPRLFTASFKPLLFVMVNAKGGARQHDPWLTVILVDRDALENNPWIPEQKKWTKPSRSHFIAVRDLLLIDEKKLDEDDSGVLEATLVNNWFTLFADPRVIQHVYVGSRIALEAAGDTPAFIVTDKAVESALKTSRKTEALGTASIHAALSADQRIATVTGSFDGQFGQSGAMDLNDVARVTLNQTFTGAAKSGQHRTTLQVGGRKSLTSVGDFTFDLIIDAKRPVAGWKVVTPKTGKLSYLVIPATLSSDKAAISVGLNGILLSSTWLTALASNYVDFQDGDTTDLRIKLGALTDNSKTIDAEVYVALSGKILPSMRVYLATARFFKRFAALGSDSENKFCLNFIRTTASLSPQTARSRLEWIPYKGNEPGTPVVIADTAVSATGGKNSTLRGTIAIDKDMSRFTFRMTMLASPDESDPQGKEQAWGSITTTYVRKDLPDDEVASVQVMRNEQQVQYLDFDEVNQKARTAPEGEKAGFAVSSVRLNTLFGKNLVALATHAAESALSVEAQHLVEPAIKAGDSPTIVDFVGANGRYFWELFFHVPFLVAGLLRDTGQYDQGWEWCYRFLLDPYRADADTDGYDVPFWNSRPLMSRTAALSAVPPTSDPEQLGYGDPVQFQKAVHLFLTELWREQGDALYRQLTRDSLGQAAQCYQKALRLIGPLNEPLSARPWKNAALGLNDERSFVPPVNEKLSNLQALLLRRVDHLRRGLTIDGTALPYLSYADEAAPAWGEGFGQQGAARRSLLRRLDVPHYRFLDVLAIARQAVDRLALMGRTLFSIYEGEAQAALAATQYQNMVDLADFSVALRKQGVEAAVLARDTLKASGRAMAGRRDYFKRLADTGVLDLEIAATALSGTAMAFRAGSTPASVSAGLTGMLPNIFGFSNGGGDWGGAWQGIIATLAVGAEIAEGTAAEMRIQADYDRRATEWRFEINQSELDIETLGHQMAEQELAIAMATREFDEARRRQSALKQELGVLTTGFAVGATYVWMIDRLEDLFAEANTATQSLCLAAESSYRYETGDFESRLLRLDAWQGLWRGMLAGEALQTDLSTMETSFTKRHERHVQARKDISISSLLSLAEGQSVTSALAKAIDAGKLSFRLGPGLFDGDFPGHYLRQIRSVALSFVVTPESEGDLSAAALQERPCMVLIQDANSILVQPSGEGAASLYDPDLATDTVLNNARASQEVVFSSLGPVDSSSEMERIVLRAEYADGRYLPFEGTGAISRWTLLFTGTKSGLSSLKDRVSDIVLHMDYSAKFGGADFKLSVDKLYAGWAGKQPTPKAAVGMLASTKPAAATAVPSGKPTAVSTTAEVLSPRAEATAFINHVLDKWDARGTAWLEGKANEVAVMDKELAGFYTGGTAYVTEWSKSRSQILDGTMERKFVYDIYSNPLYIEVIHYAFDEAKKRVRLTDMITLTRTTGKLMLEKHSRSWMSL